VLYLLQILERQKSWYYQRQKIKVQDEDYLLWQAVNTKFYENVSCFKSH
jgi:hypothetical protein